MDSKKGPLVIQRAERVPWTKEEIEADKLDEALDLNTADHLARFGDFLNDA